MQLRCRSSANVRLLHVVSECARCCMSLYVVVERAHCCMLLYVVAFSCMLLHFVVCCYMFLYSVHGFACCSMPL